MYLAARSIRSCHSFAVSIQHRASWPEAGRERLERSAIEVIEWRDGQPQADVLASLDKLATRVSEVYVHIDFDGFAPEVAPGIVDEPAPGGLSFEDAQLIIRGAAERFRIHAVTLATYTPECDEKGKALRFGLRLIDLIGESATTGFRCAS